MRCLGFPCNGVFLLGVIYYCSKIRGPAVTVDEVLTTSVVCILSFLFVYFLFFVFFCLVISILSLFLIPSVPKILHMCL